MKMMSNYDTEIVIYQSEDGQTKVDVRFEDETVWLSQKQLVELFQSSKANISEHIKAIYDEGELDEASTVRKIRTVQDRQAVDKALDEYRKYQVKTLSPVERDYLCAIEELNQSVSEQIQNKN